MTPYVHSLWGHTLKPMHEHCGDTSLWGNIKGTVRHTQALTHVHYEDIDKWLPTYIVGYDGHRHLPSTIHTCTTGICHTHFSQCNGLLCV